jgi:nucleotide-binding universal stress UspA family protein
MGMAVQEILVPVDFRTGSRRALEHTLQSFGSEGVKICALHVIDQRLLEHTLALYPDAEEADIVARLRQQAQTHFDTLIADLQADKMEIELLTVEGTPFLKIVQMARDLDVDMIVMTVRRGPDHLEQFLFGSTAERVMRITPCPILIVPEAPTRAS